MNFKWQRYDYYNIEKTHQDEENTNKFINSTLQLFKNILEDSSHSDFTLQDIIDSYNETTKKRKGQGKQHLKDQIDYLVGKGLLIYDKDEKTYSVDHNSSDVARIVEEYEREQP